MCSRCGTDLSDVLAVEAVALRFRQQAVAALNAGETEVAYQHAQDACANHRSAESIKVLAIAALACRRFEEAVQMWLEHELKSGKR